MKKQIFDGIWWIPAYPNLEVAGILTFDPIEGSTLETIGNDFSAQIKMMQGIHEEGTDYIYEPNKIEFEIILGIHKNTNITLVKCVRNGVTMAPSYRSSKWSVDIILLNCHFRFLEDIVFDNLDVEFSELTPWMNTGNLHSGFTFDDQKKLVNLGVDYQFPSPIEYFVNNIKLRFVFGGTEKSAQTDYHLTLSSYIEITPSAALSLTQYNLEIIHKLRSFLSLYMGIPIITTSIKGKSLKSYVLDRKGNHVYVPLEVLAPAQGSNLINEIKLSPNRQICNFVQLKPNFQAYLQKWFNSYDMIKSAIDLFFGLRYAPPVYARFEFLNVAQAFESYQRDMYGGQFVIPKEYEVISAYLVKQIPETLAKDHRDSLIGRIQYGYEYSLRKRMKFIFDQVLAPYKATIQKLVPDKGKFIDDFVNTRNHLTHYTEETKVKAITDPIEFNDFTIRLKKLLELCFIHETGLSSELVEEIYKENRHLSWWSDD